MLRLNTKIYLSKSIAKIVLGLIFLFASLVIFGGCTKPDINILSNMINSINDKTSPILTIDNSISNTGNFIAETDEPIKSYSLDNKTWVNVKVTQTINLTNLSDGDYSLRVKDIAGNISNNLTLMVDKTAPNIITNKINSIKNKIKTSDGRKHDYFGS